MKSDKENASYANGSGRFNNPRPQPITLSMIGSELERDWTKLASLCARAITKVFGINRK